MWNNFGDITKKLAEKAAAAAENIEGQLNQSVGATPELLASVSKSRNSNANSYNTPFEKNDGVDDPDEDPFYNDDFYADDDDDSFDVDMHAGTLKNEQEQDTATDTATVTDGQPIGTDTTGGGHDALSAQDDDVDDVNMADDEVNHNGSIPRMIQTQPLGTIGDNELKETVTDPDQSAPDREIQEEGLYDDEEDDDEEEVNFESFNEIIPQEIEINEEVPVSAVSSTKDEIFPAEIEVLQEAVPDETTNEESPTPSTPQDLDTTEKMQLTVTQALISQEAELRPQEEVLNRDHEENDPTDKIDDPTEDDEKEQKVLQDGTIEINEDTRDPVQTEVTPEKNLIADEPSGSLSAPAPSSDSTSGFHLQAEVVEESQEPTSELQADDKKSEDDQVVTPRSIEEAQSGDDGLISTCNTEEELSVYVSKEEAISFQDDRSRIISNLEHQVEQLMQQLAQRENQLTSKVEQMTAMTEMFEQDKKILEGKVRETKEEAKKRIGKAKERVQKIQDQLAEANARANSAGDESGQQEEIITALRNEGEKLAKKQSEMEQLVRESRGEMRRLKEELESEKNVNDLAKGNIVALESEMEELKNELSDAKKRGGLAEKLDSDLLLAKEEREKNASTILGLQAELKEVKARNNEMKKEMEKTLKDTVAEMESESSSIRREKDSILQDLEVKLRTSEREANMREDSLRHEVAELRKRWQESVRRCDALSIDLQQSSAPLMRQLESTERQGRVRAAAWAELESKLRSDLEENVIQNEMLTKDKIELETEMNKLHRTLQGKESELSLSTSRLEETSQRLKESSTRCDTLEKELDALKLEYTRVEKILENNESKARSEITERFRESEERYSDHIESLEVELRQEREKRSSLEEKIKEMISPEAMTAVNASKSSPKRNLGKAANQAEILHDTLLGLGGDSDDEGEHDETPATAASGSFAFIEQLSQALKASKIERDTLRKQLDDSEERRTMLENATVLNQEASKKLPSLEKQVSDLTSQILERDREIHGLQEDIIEVRQMYRTQLDALLSDAVDPESNGTSSASNQSKLPPTPLPTSFTGMRTF